MSARNFPDDFRVVKIPVCLTERSLGCQRSARADCSTACLHACLLAKLPPCLLAGLHASLPACLPASCCTLSTQEHLLLC